MRAFRRHRPSDPGAAHTGSRHGFVAELRAQIAQARFAAGGDQLGAAAMRQYGYAPRLECGRAEDGFLIGMRGGLRAGWAESRHMDRGDYFLTLTVGNPGIDDDHAVRPTTKATFAVRPPFSGVISPPLPHSAYTPGPPRKGSAGAALKTMGSTQPGDKADDRITQEIFDGEASVHVDMSASGDCRRWGFAITRSHFPSASSAPWRNMAAALQPADVAVRLFDSAETAKRKATSLAEVKRARYCAATNANTLIRRNRMGVNLYSSN